MAVSHTVANHAEKAEVEPKFQPPVIPDEEALYGDEYDFYLDLKEGFWEAERENGRDDAEITRLWESEFKQRTIQQVKESILQ